MTNLKTTSTTALQRRADPETWALVQADYAAGVPPSVLAERHGLGERNIRRRAAQESWPRHPARMDELDDESQAVLEPIRLSLADERRRQQCELLSRAKPEHLLQYAYGRATEAAVIGQPQQASHWLRIVEQLSRVRHAVERAAIYDITDGLRAGYMDDNRIHYFDEEDAEGNPLPPTDAESDTAAPDSRP